MTMTGRCSLGEAFNPYDLYSKNPVPPNWATLKLIMRVGEEVFAGEDQVLARSRRVDLALWDHPGIADGEHILSIFDGFAHLRGPNLEYFRSAKKELLSSAKQDFMKKILVLCAFLALVATSVLAQVRQRLDFDELEVPSGTCGRCAAGFQLWDREYPGEDG